MQVPPQRWTDVYETPRASASPKIGIGEKVGTCWQGGMRRQKPPRNPLVFIFRRHILDIVQRNVVAFVIIVQQIIVQFDIDVIIIVQNDVIV